MLNIPCTSFLDKLNQPVPRYTSYPTVPQWYDMGALNYVELLSKADTPLSLYIHIPFCKSMCLYCGCSVVLNRDPKKEQQYVSYLLKEIALLSLHLKEKHHVIQIHFGGGSPSNLNINFLSQIFDSLNKHFYLESLQEVCLEIDPRNISGKNLYKIEAFKKLGFNRISLGVQDFCPKVQAAVKRYQTYEETIEVYQALKQQGFTSINTDLIYGLPLQTKDSFASTVDKVLDLSPERISLFSYAKVPWIKGHQKAIRDDLLPSTEEKFNIYFNSRKKFIDSNYVAIGMDHFSKKTDSLAKSYFEHTLTRNFQGYAPNFSSTPLGLGVSSTGFVNNLFVQNTKHLSDYYQNLDKEILPITKGFLLQEDDIIRRWVILELMCRFALNKTKFFSLFQKTFSSYFLKERKDIESLVSMGLIQHDEEKISVTSLGELFIRIIASVFDKYFLRAPGKLPPKYSQAI